MISDARGTHVSPGVYTEERDVTYSVKSLGITNLGLVGETLYGPAFQNIEIEDWTSFVDYFGGTSPEKYRGTGLPKYELPYIAKSYLEKSKQLNVVRVLGLSGYHAGPVWVIYTCGGPGNPNRPLVILRSKMVYGAVDPDDINRFCTEAEDTPQPVVSAVEIGPYNAAGYTSMCESSTGPASAVSITSNKKFSLTVGVNNEMFPEYNSQYLYNVSLDPRDSDYIYKVLSSRPDTGVTPLYIEAVYENSLEGCDGIGGIAIISGGTYDEEKKEEIKEIPQYDYCQEVYDATLEDSGEQCCTITLGDKEICNCDTTYGGDAKKIIETYKKNGYGEILKVGLQDVLYEDFISAIEENNGVIDCNLFTILRRIYADNKNAIEALKKIEVAYNDICSKYCGCEGIKVIFNCKKPEFITEPCDVVAYVSYKGDYDEGTGCFYYKYNGNMITTCDTCGGGTLNPGEGDNWWTYDGEKFNNLQELQEYLKEKQCLDADNYNGIIFHLGPQEPAADYYDDYCEMYRPAQTPWFVSEAYASVVEDATWITMKKLFKFITISDGDASNYQVKVSIQRVNPKYGTFDVLVRDFNDTDANPVVLEKFSNCTLVKGSDSFLPFKIGSYDGGFVAKSKYITVQMSTEEDLSGSVPCGYLGYPMPMYGQQGEVIVKYNKTFNPSEKVRSQYFGLTEKNIDEDMLKYKGVYFYDENGDDRTYNVTKGFHMDSILNKVTSDKVYIDGFSGYSFDCVSSAKVTSDANIPRIINAPYMNTTIYKDEKVRKFTAYFYGGFDGWDINRTSRTNTDEYKASKYPVSGSTVFKTFEETNGLNMALDLPETAITSDYYAYLAGYRVFSNPQNIDINLFATPGIDWNRNTLLTMDVIDLIEDGEDGRGGDALYIMASPDFSDNITSVNDLVSDFNDKEINSSYACTYFPWVMYYDSSNKTYINLPVTKDVVRNMAETDNNDAPWFAPAGLLRGNVDCIKAGIKTTLPIEDQLYNNNINPVKTFARDGVKVWGNKTTYLVDSPLNRINVRRLMIRVKKLVTDAARHLIFEQYTDTLDKQFKGLVEPILAEVKSKRGIYDYRIKTENTPETRDQHILPARILIKPTSALEYISISFVVYPESVSFMDD